MLFAQSFRKHPHPRLKEQSLPSHWRFRFERCGYFDGLRSTGAPSERPMMPHQHRRHVLRLKIPQGLDYHLTRG